MILVDSLLVGGIKFVLEKVAAAVESELDDDKLLRERLLEAQMRLELGEIDEAEFVVVERDVLARLREIREQAPLGSTCGGNPPGEGPSARPGELKVTGIEATFAGDDHDSDGDG